VATLPWHCAACHPCHLASALEWRLGSGPSWDPWLQWVSTQLRWKKGCYLQHKPLTDTLQYGKDVATLPRHYAACHPWHLAPGELSAGLRILCLRPNPKPLVPVGKYAAEVEARLVFVNQASTVTYGKDVTTLPWHCAACHPCHLASELTDILAQAQAQPEAHGSSWKIHSWGGSNAAICNPDLLHTHYLQYGKDLATLPWHCAACHPCHLAPGKLSAGLTFWLRPNPTRHLVPASGNIRKLNISNIGGLKSMLS